MTMTAIIGALVALAPPAILRPKTDREIERLRELVRLERALASAERDLSIQKSLTEHWKEEAKRIATQTRELREEVDRLREDRDNRDLQAQYAFLRQSQIQALANQYAQAQAQQAQAQHAQAQQAQALGLRQLQWEEGRWGGYCNCVPGRSQVWAAEQRAISEGKTP